MTDVELVLLAGGAGSRMGGDKLRLRDAAGRLLVADWFTRLAWPTPPRLVLPPGGTPPNELSAWPTAHDAVAGEGPLQGIEAALAATTADWLLIVAVDTPGIGRAQLEWLLDRRVTDAAARLWMTRRGEGIEPFPLLIHRDSTPCVSARLAQGPRSLHGLSTEPTARVVDAPAQWSQAVWRNLNRPGDLAAYLQSAGRL